MSIPAALSPERVAELAGFDSGTIANAVDSLGARHPTAGFASLELRCLIPDLPPSVGYAVTCTEDTTTPLGGPREGYAALLEAVEASPKPAIVVFKAVGQDRLRSCHIGDMMSVLLQRLGVVAVVTDGAARDIGGVRERAPGFQLFAAGTVPGAGDYTMLDVGVQVSICGLTVRPGDLLHGDVNGLLSIPRGVADQIAARAREIQAKEKRFVDYVKEAPEFSVRDLAKRFGPPWG